MATTQEDRPAAIGKSNRTAGRDHVHSGPAAEPADTIANSPTQHAFITLGTKTLFLCHLTMYGPDPEMESHMYQAILEASLPDGADEKYRSERLAHPKETYFLGNSPRDLLTMPELTSRARTWFMADVFRGIPQQNEYRSGRGRGEKRSSRTCASRSSV